MGQTAFELNRGLWREIRPRLGVRARVGTPIRWRAAPVGPSNAAVLHDLSVSGARLLLPADPAVVLRARLSIELDGAWAPADVVWVEPSEHPSARWCGLAFVEPDAEVLAAVERLTGLRPGEHAASDLSWEQGGAGSFSA